MNRIDTITAVDKASLGQVADIAKWRSGAFGVFLAILCFDSIVFLPHGST